VASFKFGPWWVLWVLVCSWFACAPKVLQPRTNQLVIWFVQIRLNNWPTCHFLVPIPKLQHVSLPPKCYKLRNVPQLLFLPLFPLLDSHWSLSRSVGGCHHHHNLWFRIKYICNKFYLVLLLLELCCQLMISLEILMPPLTLSSFGAR